MKNPSKKKKPLQLISNNRVQLKKEQAKENN
jgi:hypothetical protein